MPRYSPEQATQMLGRVPEQMPDMRAYLTALSEGTLPQYYLGVFSHKRTAYMDDLPLVDVRELIQAQQPVPDSLTQYKCQTNYVLGLCLKLKSALDDEVITDEVLTADIGNFLLSDLNFNVGDPRNTERIASINTILDRTIAHLTPNPQP